MHHTPFTVILMVPDYAGNSDEGFIIEHVTAVTATLATIRAQIIASQRLSRAVEPGNFVCVACFAGHHENL